MNGGVLIIGYGNTLRGDDGVGPYIVDRLSQRNRTGVQTRVVFQLTPELSQEVAGAVAVIFVDADTTTEAVRCDVVEESAETDSFTHVLGPQLLLRLARTVFGSAPPAWMVRVAGQDYALGEQLSDVARGNAARALDVIDNLLSELQ